MSPTEAIPLLVVVLLLISAGGGDIQELSITFQGDTSIDTLNDVHVVAGGTSTIESDGSITGDIYVIGGEMQVDGLLEGDVTLLSGNLSVTDGATITGTLRSLSGQSSIAETARIGSIASYQAPSPRNPFLQRISGLLLQFLGLGIAGWWLGRRHPRLLRNVGHAITDQTLASGVVGALGATTLLVIFVYMAFTILLIPIAVLGLLGELFVVLYGQVAFGFLIGTRLPIDRAPLATVAGIGVLVLLMEAFSFVPVFGGLLQLGVAAIGFGAVLNTYFGFTRFEPVRIPG